MRDASASTVRDNKQGPLDRRSFLKTAVTTAAGALLAPALPAAERDWSGQKPVRYPDPDIVVLDPRFEKYRQFNAAIERLWTGARWAEGPVWFGDGRYLLFSDIPNNRILRWTEETQAVHIFAPDGKRIGQIRLPGQRANLCFGGAKRNRLFMTASQSLYALYVNTQGAQVP